VVSLRPALVCFRVSKILEGILVKDRQCLMKCEAPRRDFARYAFGRVFWPQGKTYPGSFKRCQIVALRP
jgi:hypothetical protein